MSYRVSCPACDTVVYPDAVAVSDHNFGYTWLGDRAKWTHQAFGVVHLCDPAARDRVWRRDRLPVAAPPWVRWWNRNVRGCQGSGRRYTARLKIEANVPSGGEYPE